MSFQMVSIREISPCSTMMKMILKKEVIMTIINTRIRITFKMTSI